MIVGNEVVISRWRVLWKAFFLTKGPLVVVSRDKNGEVYVAGTHGETETVSLLKPAYDWLSTHE